MTHRYQENADFAATLDANRVQQEMLKTWSQSYPVQKQKTLEDEVRRVARFVNDQQEGIELSAKDLFLRADAVATGLIRSVQESFGIVGDLKMSTRQIVHDCIALQDFFTASRKILLDHASMADEKNQGTNNCSSMVHQIMPKANLNSSLVCVISDIYNAFQQAEEKILNKNNAGGNEVAVWQAPSSFQRATTKYWVKDENLTKLMMTCAKEAPLLVYGKKGPLTSTNRHSDGDKLWDSLATRITSIYFDSDDMSLYNKRIDRAEGAQLLRVRWYGTTMPTGDKIVFVELKTHHEKWVAQKSVKERVSIQERDMINFLRPVRWKREDAQQMILRAKPKMKEEELAKATGLLFRMHNLVVNHQLTACVRSVYDRAAFQSSKSNDLRLTLDRNVTLVNERVQRSSTGASSGRWCLTDSEAQTARASVVPFNVFEVKLASDDPMPTGLAEAQNDSTIEMATKFSKFLTGAAAFNAVATLPYWASHPAFYLFFELERRYVQRSSSESSDADQANYNLMGSSDEMVSDILPSTVVIAPKNPARIEPKTFFANERTFVQWINSSIMLLTVSSFLLATGNFNGTAAVISLSAFGLVVYSTGLYFKRLNLLKDRQPYGYFNRVNPILLTSVVGLAIFLVWVDSIKGSDFLAFFSSEERDQRLLQPLLPGRMLQHSEYERCSQDVIETKVLIKENPSSLMVDFKRHSFLMTLDESVYIQAMNDDKSGLPKVDLLIRINQSRLQGLAMVGDQLFAVSDGPEFTELVEMAWWRTHDGNERLRVVRRWKLEDSRSQVDGFSFVPSNDSASIGHFYINIHSSIRVYSIPARSENEESYQAAHPIRQKSLNMKVLTQGTSIGDCLSTMITFEGITYILRSKKNVLEAWNLTDGTLSSEIQLPVTEENDSMMMKWTGFALERRIAIRTQTPNIRGAHMPGIFPSDPVFLHLMTNEATFVGKIWSFPILEDIEMPSGLFSVPDCQVVTTTMN